MKNASGAGEGNVCLLCVLEERIGDIEGNVNKIMKGGNDEDGRNKSYERKS